RAVRTCRRVGALRFERGRVGAERRNLEGRALQTRSRLHGCDLLADRRAHLARDVARDVRDVTRDAAEIAEDPRGKGNEYGGEDTECQTTCQHAAPADSQAGSARGPRGAGCLDL